MEKRSLSSLYLITLIRVRNLLELYVFTAITTTKNTNTIKKARRSSNWFLKTTVSVL